MTMSKRAKAVTKRGELRLGTMTVDCYVLDDGRRVLTKNAMVKALTGGRTENSHLDSYMARLASRSGDLSVGTEIEFDMKDGGFAVGREASDLVEICKAYQAAFLDGALHGSQDKIARSAMAMLASLAGVGIVSLVDEATEYQKTRRFGALQDLFDRIFRKESVDWDRMFEPSLVIALCKLDGYQWEGGAHPGYLKSTLKKIYDFLLGTETAAEMKVRNPDPRHGQNHHQTLQPEVRDYVRAELKIVEVIANQSGSKVDFWKRMSLHYKKQPYQLGFDEAAE